MFEGSNGHAPKIPVFTLDVSLSDASLCFGRTDALVTSVEFGARLEVHLHTSAVTLARQHRLSSGLNFLVLTGENPAVSISKTKRS